MRVRILSLAEIRAIYEPMGYRLFCYSDLDCQRWTLIKPGQPPPAINDLSSLDAIDGTYNTWMAEKAGKEFDTDSAEHSLFGNRYDFFMFGHHWSDWMLEEVFDKE